MLLLSPFEVPVCFIQQRACVQVDADGDVLETSGACVGAESAAVDCNLKLLETFTAIRTQADSEDRANSGLLNTFSRYHFSFVKSFPSVSYIILKLCYCEISN